MSKINKIRLSGTDYDIQDVSATSVVELTQQQYDDLPASAKTDNILYIITDSTVDYVTSAQTQSAITQAVSGKVDTATYTAYTAATDTALANKQTTLTAGTGISIVDNVISATGGGSSYTAGDGIDITNNVISVTGRVSTSDFNTYSGSVESRLSEDEEVTAAGLNALNDKIDSISGANAIEVTQAEYEALVTGGTVDPNAFYIITDAQAGDLTNYYTKTETNTLLGGKADTATTYTKTEVDTLLGGKQDTLVSGTNIKTINNESILGEGNIDIQGGGGGKAIEAGRGISITTGETADTVSFSLPISAGTGSNSIIEGNTTSIATGTYSHAEGSGTKASGFCSHTEGSFSTANGNYSHAEGFGPTANGQGSHAEGGSTNANGNYSHAEGDTTTAKGRYSHTEGWETIANNQSEHASGQYNNSVSASTTFGDSGNTLFSVGNGTADNARHNAFEIRQNGDIYLTKDGQDVKLQDQLGGSSITVDTVLDSGSTNPVENRVIYNKIDEVEEVTAAGLNALNDALGGMKLVKLTQTEYDNLSTKDSNTLYLIVN